MINGQAYMYWGNPHGSTSGMACITSGLPENICYATSTNATGPWAFKGVIIPAQGGSSTDHPGIMDYKGHSYFFYHNDALPGGGS